MALQLATYFDRIGCSSDTKPTLKTLAALSLAHARHIPFANASLLLDGRVSIEPEDIQHKLVDRHLGGYCFEQNGLFLDVLQALGFAAKPVGARIRLGTKDRSVLPQLTHMAILVTIGDKTYLADVGVGGFSLTAPLLLADGIEQHTPHETRRLQYTHNKWFHQVKKADGWQDVYEFEEREMLFVDRKVGNWYTSTHPDSHFTSTLTVAIAGTEGKRFSLAQGVFKVRQAGKLIEEHEVTSAGGLQTLLKEIFALEYSKDDCQRLLNYL